MASLLIINLRGTINAKRPIKQTLRQLHLLKRYRATIITDSPDYLGMLKKAEHHVAWYTLNKSLLERLLRKVGRREGNEPITEGDLKREGFQSFGELAEAIAQGRVQFTKLRWIKPYLSLPPPKGGFARSLKRLHTEGGLLGENPELPALIDSMLWLAKEKGSTVG